MAFENLPFPTPPLPSLPWSGNGDDAQIQNLRNQIQNLQAWVNGEGRPNISRFENIFPDLQQMLPFKGDLPRIQDAFNGVQTLSGEFNQLRNVQQQIRNQIDQIPTASEIDQQITGNIQSGIQSMVPPEVDARLEQMGVYAAMNSWDSNRQKLLNVADQFDPFRAATQTMFGNADTDFSNLSSWSGQLTTALDPSDVVARLNTARDKLNTVSERVERLSTEIAAQYSNVMSANNTLISAIDSFLSTGSIPPNAAAWATWWANKFGEFVAVFNAVKDAAQANTAAFQGIAGKADDIAPKLVELRDQLAGVAARVDDISVPSPPTLLSTTGSPL